jgi:hypothetical protein
MWLTLPSFFCQDRILLTFLLSWPQDTILPIPASGVTGISGVSYLSWSSGLLDYIDHSHFKVFPANFKIWRHVSVAGQCQEILPPWSWWGSRLTHETTRSAHKVEFIREKGKASERRTGSPCCLHREVFHLVLFVGEGSQESGMELSFNISLQEHTHSPVKASWLSALWHFEASPRGPWLVKPPVPLQDVGLMVYSRGGWGHWLIFVFWSPRPNISIDWFSFSLLSCFSTPWYV